MCYSWRIYIRLDTVRHRFLCLSFPICLFRHPVLFLLYRFLFNFLLAVVLDVFLYVGSRRICFLCLNSQGGQDGTRPQCRSHCKGRKLFFHLFHYPFPPVMLLIQIFPHQQKFLYVLYTGRTRGIPLIKISLFFYYGRFIVMKRFYQYNTA